MVAAGRRGAREKDLHWILGRLFGNEQFKSNTRFGRLQSLEQALYNRQQVQVSRARALEG